MASRVSLTPIKSVLDSFYQERISFPCLKVIRIRPMIGGDVNYKLRLSDGIAWVRAYFVNPEFDQFVEDGSIRVGTIIELRKYIQGTHGGGSRYLGIVWLYPYPQPEPEPEPEAKNNMEASMDQIQSQTTKKRHRNGGDEGKTEKMKETLIQAPEIESPNKKIRPIGSLGATSTAVTSDPNQGTWYSQGRPETSSTLEIAHGIGTGIVTARQHLNSNSSNPAISSSRNSTISSSFLVYNSQLTEEMLNMKRTMLNDLANKHMRNANFLVVVTERRQRHDSNSLPKQDWYLWDESSGDRKTILSVWGELCIDFQPTPGTIVALWNIQINTRYEDNPNSSRLLRLPTGGLGHLNVYKHKHPKFVIDPKQVVGYEELRAAWNIRTYQLMLYD